MVSNLELNRCTVRMLKLTMVVLRELEEEDKLIQSRRQKWRANKAAAAARAAAEQANADASKT